VKFLIDAQLPPVLAEYLRDRGHEAAHVFDLDDVSLPDEAIWDVATSDAWTIVTKDKDFADFVAARREGPAVVWVRIGNCTNAALREAVRVNWLRIVDRLRRGDRLVEVR
jgi:predicted nuclease of predicted toxin-antitoxin system